jgi:hypothetical protein
MSEMSEVAEVQESGVSSPEGKSYAEMSSLMDELLSNRQMDEGKRGATAEVGPEWDKMTLLTGGFVPVGSIFWARPPKLRNQQKIMLALQKARGCMQPFLTGEDVEAVANREGFMEALFEQGSIMAGLAQELFFVYAGDRSLPELKELIQGKKITLTKMDFRQATEEEIVCDETGMTPENIMETMNRLMGMSQSDQGNA